MSRELEKGIGLSGFSHVETVQPGDFLNLSTLDFVVNRPVSEFGVKQIAAGLGLHVARVHPGLQVSKGEHSTWFIGCRDLGTSRPKFELMATHIIPQERGKVLDFVRHLGHPNFERPAKSEMHKLTVDLLVKSHVMPAEYLPQGAIGDEKLQLKVNSGKAHRDIGIIAANLDLHLERKKSRRITIANYISQDESRRNIVQVSKAQLAELKRRSKTGKVSLIEVQRERLRDMVLSPSRKNPRWTVKIRDVPNNLHHVQYFDLTVEGKNITGADREKINWLIDSLKYMEYPRANLALETLARGIAALRKLKPKKGK